MHNPPIGNPFGDAQHNPTSVGQYKVDQIGDKNTDKFGYWQKRLTKTNAAMIWSGRFNGSTVRFP